MGASRRRSGRDVLRPALTCDPLKTATRWRIDSCHPAAYRDASRELAEQLAPSAGLRNRLVHEYEGLDDARVLAAIETMLTLYPQYVRAIEAFLTRAVQDDTAKE